MNEPWIQTYTGKAISLENPDPDLIDIEDIAHALSNIGRFTGHTRQFYSTAQHSVLVASLMPPELQMWGLCHDMSEAYLGDVSSPLKALLPTYSRIEYTWQQTIYTKFNVVRECPPTILKEADLAALAIEATQLLGDISGWNLPPYIKPADIKIVPWKPEIAKDFFLSAFDTINAGDHLPSYQQIQRTIFAF